MTEQSNVSTDKKACCGSCSSMRSVGFIIMVLLIAGAVFCLGRYSSYPGGYMMGGGFMHPGFMNQGFMENRMNKMLDTIEATPEQRAKMQKFYNERFNWQK